MNTKPKIAYLCDGLAECSEKIGCYRNSYTGICYCRHTTDPKHALNGTVNDPEAHPERFSKLDVQDESGAQYWEGGFDFP